MKTFRQKKGSHFRNFEILVEGVKFEFKIEEGYFSQPFEQAKSNT